MTAAALPAAHAQQKWTRYRAPEFVERPGWSVGMNFGMSDLWGDVGTKSPLFHYANSKYWQRPHFMGGIFTRYALHPGFVVRAGINYGSVYANDNWNYDLAKNASTTEEDAYQRYFRNQDVKANIWEGNLLFEINVRRLGNLEAKGAKKRMQPYLLVGGGYFHYRTKGMFTPRGTDGRPNGQSREVDMFNLYLENQGTNTPEVDSVLGTMGIEPGSNTQKLWVPEVCGGLGLRWDIADQVSLGVEYLYRYTFTDYLDGVSGKYIDPRAFDVIHSDDPIKAQMAKDMYDKSWLVDKDFKHSPGEIRGNASDKDGYSTIAISVFFRIKTKRVPWWYQPGPGVY
jgi:hypothetical protein